MSKAAILSTAQVTGHALSPQVAVTRGTPIMSEKWITECWEHREDANAVSTKPPFSNHKQLPFTGCIITLYGFQREEEAEMKEIAVLNGEELALPVGGIAKC